MVFTCRMINLPLEAHGRRGQEPHGGLEHLARRLHRLVLLLLHLFMVMKYYKINLRPFCDIFRT